MSREKLYNILDEVVDPEILKSNGLDKHSLEMAKILGGDPYINKKNQLRGIVLRSMNEDLWKKWKKYFKNPGEVSPPGDVSPDTPGGKRVSFVPGDTFENPLASGL